MKIRFLVLSHWNFRNLTLQTLLSITRDFGRLHSTFARLYNAAASPASRVRSAELVGNNRNNNNNNSNNNGNNNSNNNNNTNNNNISIV